MSSIATQSTPVQGTPHRLRVAIGSAVGTTIENYDFLGYGTAAGLYLGKAFFPGTDALTGTLLSGAGPIGGSVGGYRGDKIGRKPVRIASLLVRGLATFAIGLLPTYATVGALAPILLVIVRIVQGLAFGAEWGGAILLTYEHAPWRHKGRYGGIPQAGFPLGILLADLALYGSSGLDGDWRWRVPFLLSAILVAAGLYVRLRLSESPEFQAIQDRGAVQRNPLLAVLKDDWRNVLRAFGMRIAETAGYAVAITYLTSYVTSQLQPGTKHTLATTPETIIALAIAAAIGLPATILWGSLTDRIGRKPVFLVATALMVVLGVPFFLLVNTGSAVLIVLVFVVSFAVCQNALAGTESAWFPELFETGTRSSGASLAYQLSAVVSGFTATIAVALFQVFGFVGPALLYSVFGLIGLIAALATHETNGAARRAEEDRAVQGVAAPERA